ncbi:MAG: spermidine synthase [Anaerolineales bacterium]|uniref:fused MFS/spermidine synthase n=1 Tax=Candidatus Villigracilis proximus TaxID=3140683 RepID=UPI003135441C|nr:spermidine synthase [Anaerolineales bacterium]
MLFFALSIFLSAFLLFQIQPMIGKFILPWFGGTPAVWSTAMLFFQVLLTGGYAYAYWLVKRPKQGWIHIALLGMTLALLTALGLAWPSPITPAADMRPVAANFPVLDIFLLLTISVGLPYFVLASNGPLMQAWFSRIFPEQSYARLYALSNVGSLFGLLAYPILVEPSLTLFQQGWAWSGGLILFVLVAGILSYRARNENGAATQASTAEKPSGALRVLWIILSGTASLFLLSVTNQVSQEVAVIPFLWIVPLAVYLLSFIFAFSDSRWYDRRVYALLFSITSLAMLWTLVNASSLNVIVQIAIYNLLLFLASMICHGELYRLRPHADHLTSFYLMVSLGGAAGGIFVNLIAPFIFTGYWEFYLGWLMTMILLVVMLWPRFMSQVRLQARAINLSFLAGVLLLSFGLNRYENALFVERNFYGVIRVRELDENADTMIHGMTVHGIQYLADRARPTTYYVEDSGVGLLLLNHPQRGQNLRVGVLGLGVGTLATYAEEGDVHRYYEINPVVIRLAEGEGGYFTFLNDSKAEISVVAGDARISLEQELAAGENQNFDVLVLDTFSSDSIPVHLVTKEAFALYLDHLAPDGVIAAHISNRHLDLRPVFWQLAQEFGLEIVQVDRLVSSDGNGFPSNWVLMTRNATLLEIPAIKSHSTSFEGYTTSIKLWTDDYSNLFQILK